MIDSRSEEIHVEVKSLHKHFGSLRAVDDASFSFGGGDVHGFIGSNGAGKTTTMRIIATLDAPTKGDVLVNGISATEYPEKVCTMVGFMPDYLDTYKDMIVHEYLDFYARAYRLPLKRRQIRIDDVVEFTGIGYMLNHPVVGLSKGMKQRLSLGRILLNNPQILILDEPAAGLDPRARIELRDLCRKLADRGKAVFISSHILSELSEICDCVTIIEQGKIHASANVQTVMRDIDAGIRVRVCVLGNEENERLSMFLAEQTEVISTEIGEGGVIFCYDGEVHHRTQLLKRLINENFEVTDFHSASSDLEDAFLALTGGDA